MSNNDNPLEPLSEEAREALQAFARLDPLPLHKQLKAAREAKGISLRKLASMSGTSHQNLFRYEKGEDKVLGIAKIQSVCDALNLHLTVISR